jgi:hypothetical protein
VNKLKVTWRLWRVTLGAVVWVAQGCNLSPQPEPPFSDTSSTPTGSLGENNEMPGVGGGVGPDFAADAGAVPTVPPGGMRADAGVPDGSVPGDTGTVP